MIVEWFIILEIYFNIWEFYGHIIENFSYLELVKNKKLFSDEIKTYNKLNGSEIDFIYCYREWGVVPIEIKLKNNDIIPKIFYSFEKDYHSQIKYFIRTTTHTTDTRELGIKKIDFMPFFMISTQI